jgi:hypothetical protein
VSANTTPAHLDPAQVPACMRADAHREQWEVDAGAAHAALMEVSGIVHSRIVRCQSLDCAPLATPDAYHVTGGRDPDGHTVDLRAEWGSVCTCGDHMWSHHYCKHLMRVQLELGRWFSDDCTYTAGATGDVLNLPIVRVPGIYSEAVARELETLAAKRAETTEGK